jgi:hypothetical protein
MAEEIGVPSLTLQFEKAPTRAGSRERGPSIVAAGLFYLRKSSGSLAIFAAIRRELTMRYGPAH